MLQKVTWKSWVVILALLIAYVILGVFYSSNNRIDYLIYEWSLAGGTLAPILLIGIYAYTHNQWWTNDVSTALVRTLLCLIPFAGPLAYVFWVQNGVLGPGMLAWIEVASPALSVIAILYMCFVFARAGRRHKAKEEEEEE